MALPADSPVFRVFTEQLLQLTCDWTSDARDFVFRFIFLTQALPSTYQDYYLGLIFMDSCMGLRSLG